MSQIAKNKLGKLEKVDLRSIWKTEAGDFTPWLARDENISLLGDTISLDLEVEAQEKQVGPFRADILCRDTASGDWVLVENQLERTDHTHLGQLMTYAGSGRWAEAPNGTTDTLMGNYRVAFFRCNKP